MNKIYLDKLCEFALTTHKNYEFNNKNFNFDEIVGSIKQNNSLNENGIFLKHNFIELKLLISSIEYDQLLLINPLCFNLHSNIRWYNFLNSLLTVLNDNYLHETNLMKKKILETADKTYQKKIIVENNLNDSVIENVCIITGITLILLNSNSSKIKLFNYDKKKNSEYKVIVLFNYNEQYYPIINWNKKYFNIKSQFINYLIEISLSLNADTSDVSNVSNVSDATNESDVSDATNEFIKVTKKNKKKSSEIDIQNLNNNVLKNINFDNQNSTHSSNKNIAKSIGSKNIFDDFNDFDDLDDLDNLNDLDNNNDANNNDANNNIINLNKKNINTNKLSQSTKVINNDNNNKKDCYAELTTNENYAIYISEAIEVKDNSKIQVNTDNKKKSKKSKNIFVTTQNTLGDSISNNNNDNNDDKNKKNNDNKNNDNIDKNILVDNDTSIFVKTEKISKKDIDNILNNLKPTLTLEQLQSYAIKLDISVFEGSTKSGKPKNKTKSELIEKIKEVCKSY